MAIIILKLIKLNDSHIIYYKAEKNPFNRILRLMRNQIAHHHELTNNKLISCGHVPILSCQANSRWKRCGAPKSKPVKLGLSRNLTARQGTEKFLAVLKRKRIGDWSLFFWFPWKWHLIIHQLSNIIMLIALFFHALILTFSWHYLLQKPSHSTFTPTFWLTLTNISNPSHRHWLTSIQNDSWH